MIGLSASLLFYLSSLILYSNAQNNQKINEDVIVKKHTWKLGFGSCLHQLMPAPTLIAAAQEKPDVWLWLGDNVYHDMSERGVICEPLECKDFSSVLKAYVAIFGMKLFSLLLENKYTHSWIGSAALKFIRAHNQGENEVDLEEMRGNYETLRNKKEFIALKEAVPEQIATWDDHDYCRNDAGKNCKIKQQSKEMFLSFWRREEQYSESKASDLDTGIYNSYFYTIPPEVTKTKKFEVQVIVLDTRYFRSDLLYKDDVLDSEIRLKETSTKKDKSEECNQEDVSDNIDTSTMVEQSPPLEAVPSLVPEWCRTPWDESKAEMYCPHSKEAIKLFNDLNNHFINNAEDDEARSSFSSFKTHPAPTVLGEEQWRWLESQLTIPDIDMRIIASSITVLPTYNGLEAWSLFPEERKRLIELIVKSKQNGVLILSGDIHYAEISKLVPERLNKDLPKNQTSTEKTTKKDRISIDETDEMKSETKDLSEIASLFPSHDENGSSDSDNDSGDLMDESNSGSPLYNENNSDGNLVGDNDSLNLLYPLYEATSSGLTMSDYCREFEIMHNENRLKGSKPYGGPGYNNWGMLEINFDDDVPTLNKFDSESFEMSGPKVSLNLMNEAGEIMQQTSFHLEHISASEEADYASTAM